jgi:hypothetical protein
MEEFPLLDVDESNPIPIPNFTILEKAPQGTKAKIFIKFTKALTPQQLKDNPMAHWIRVESIVVW